MKRKRVLVTGAGGIIAGKVLPALRERYDLVPLDIRSTDREGNDIDGVVTADLLNRDRDTYRQHFRGVDAVIHSGFVRADEPKQRFWAELDNVAMAYNVYQTCVEERVPRVVVISSNHAADFYEEHLLAGRLLSIGPETIPYSYGFYGWAKIAYEALGFVFAVGRINDGVRLPNVHLRIGAPRETDILKCEPGDTRKLHRDLGAYISLRDEVQLIEKSIEAPSIENEYGVPFQVFYGVSGNTGNFWSIENARRVVGYEPEDDAIVRFADHVARILGVAAGK
jgi:hypothetical protein